MKFLVLIILAGVVGIVPVFCLELVLNGDFEQPLATGWDEIIGAASYSISRSTHYDPDPDYEAQVSQGTGSGYVRLFQIFTVPSTDLDFAANLKLYAWDNSSGPWAGAALIVSYHDDFENLLGETYICAYSADCPWTNTSTRHLIVASDSSWHPYSFNLASELFANLPGVNGADIKKIKISLYTQTYHC
jgi:hypothetical protein